MAYFFSSSNFDKLLVFFKIILNFFGLLPIEKSSSALTVSGLNKVLERYRRIKSIIMRIYVS